MFLMCKLTVIFKHEPRSICEPDHRIPAPLTDEPHMQVALCRRPLLNANVFSQTFPEMSRTPAEASSVLSAHLQHVSSYVVLQRPVERVQDLDHLLLLQDGEQAVQEDLEADGDGLRAVQHQAADVEHHIGVDDLHLAALVHVVHLQLAQG